jgi:hypothetical protein
MSTPAWLQTLAKIAPSIASVAGGPFAGMAVSFVESALGVTAGADGKKPDAMAQLQQRIDQGTLTGDQVIALKKAEMDFKQHIADNGLKLEQLAAEDRASARGREIAVRDRTPAVLAYVMVIGFFALTAATIGFLFGWPEQAGKMPAPAWGLVGTLIGYLLNESKSALSYYFGTTEGNETSVPTDFARQVLGTPSGQSAK